MAPADRPPAHRDRQLSLLRRLRVAVVSTGLLGSLGVAGVAAVTEADGAAADTTSTDTSTPAPRTGQSAPRGTGDDSFSRRPEPPGEAAAPGSRSAGRARSQAGPETRPAPQVQGPPPRVQPGGGSAHGRTGGS